MAHLLAKNPGKLFQSSMRNEAFWLVGLVTDRAKNLRNGHGQLPNTICRNPHSISDSSPGVFVMVCRFFSNSPISAAE